MSLTLSGVLTDVLVRQLEFDNAQQQLARGALLLRPQVGGLDCLQRYAPPRVGCQVPARTLSEFITNVGARIGDLSLSGNRLVLLDRRSPPRVIYDSAATLPPGQQVPLGREIRVSGQVVTIGTVTLDGGQYFAAASRTPTSRYAGWLVLARPRSAVVAQANGELVPPIMIAGLAGLVLAILFTLLLSRAFARPLRELRSAAEDIAGGNYSRRVGSAGGDEVGVVGQSFNRMAEAVERARAQQRAFLANVSHELKTPLTSLIGFSQALVDGSLHTDQEKTRAATILHEEAQRVLRMSQELLDLARVESGELALQAHPVDLGAHLEQEIEIVRARARAQGLTVQLGLPASLPPVLADPDRLHQILENLLDNAVKYAPRETDVWISVEAHDGRVTTSVRNRVGVPAPDPARIFERFYRADPSRSSVARGVGLGLAISRELATAQDGTLVAEMDDGALCMKLDLPAARPPPAGHESAARSAPVAAAPRGRAAWGLSRRPQPPPP